MMKFPLCVILGFLLLSCSGDDPIPEQEIKDDTWIDPLAGIPDKGPLRFDNPEVGQRSRYIAFKATQDWSTKKVTFTYSPDTLVLAITGKEGDNWVVREFLSEGSKDGSWSGFAGDEEIIRHLFIDMDSAYFTRPANAYFLSFLFLFDKMAIPLQPVADPSPENPQCIPAFSISRTDTWVQYTINYTQHGQDFDHLNGYFDYTGVATDGLGFMYAYGPPYGIVRWSWVSYWDPGEAEGWDLIPH